MHISLLQLPAPEALSHAGKQVWAARLPRSREEAQAAPVGCSVGFLELEVQQPAPGMLVPAVTHRLPAGSLRQGLVSVVPKDAHRRPPWCEPRQPGEGAVKAVGPWAACFLSR